MVLNYLFPLADERNPQSSIDYSLIEKFIPWTIACVIALIAAIIMIKRENKSETKLGIYKAYAYYFIGFIIARLLFFLSDIENWNSGETILYSQFVLLSYCVGIIAASSLIKMMETNILRYDKRYLSMIFFIIGFSSMVVAFLGFFIDITYILTVIRTIIVIVSTLGAFVLMVLFTKIVRSSTGELRKKAFLTLFGIVFIFVGSILDAKAIREATGITIWIPPLFAIVGVFLIAYFQKTE